MNLVALADIHGRLPRLDTIRPAAAGADLLVLTGDVTHLGRRREALEILETLSAIHLRLLAVTGNCDYPEVADALHERGCLLEIQPVEVHGVWLMGVGGSLPGPFRTPHEVSENELESALNSAAAFLPDGTGWILVSHQPPLDTVCDQLADGTHVGSQAVRAFIEERQPLLCLTGHIHEFKRHRSDRPNPDRQSWTAWGRLGGQGADRRWKRD